MSSSDDRIRKTSDWRHLFEPEVLREATSSPSLKNIKMQRSYSWYTAYDFIFPSFRNLKASIGTPPSNLNDSWDQVYFFCSCRKKYCVHLAAAMLHWEKIHGPWIVEEDDYSYRKRKNQESFDKMRAEYQQETQRLGTEPVPALTAFRNRGHEDGAVLYFDMEKVLSSLTTTPAAIARLKEVPQYLERFANQQVSCSTTREGKKTIHFDMCYDHPLVSENVFGYLDENRLMLSHSLYVKKSPESHSYITRSDMRKPNDPLDQYDLYTLEMVWQEVESEGKQEITDAVAERFFSSIRKIREDNVKQEIRTVEIKPPRQSVVELLPRIVMEDGNASLSFKIGISGSRKYIVKDCFNLIHAFDEEKDYVLGKKETLHFSSQTFRPEYSGLFDFIKRNQAPSFGGVYQLELSGSRLDNFYDMYEGGECELMDKTNHIKDELVKVGHMDIRFTLTANRLSDIHNNFIGIAVSGFIPVLISGSSYKYVLNTTGLSRISSEERKVLSPFLAVADASGYFRFQVGKDRLQEFYYRVLPGLLDNPFVDFIDNCQEEAASCLPPEPAFGFYLALETSVLSLEGVVRYDNLSYPLVPLKKSELRPEYHDNEQEARVISAIRSWLPDYSAEKGIFYQNITDEYLYDFLTSGIASLEYYGEVQGSSAFRTRKIISDPQVSVGISVDAGGLLNISVTSKALSDRELLELYDSYTKKKRFYRLKSGDYVDLAQEEQLPELTAFLEQMDLAPAEVIQQKIQIPIYRALYLNRMLEDHEKLASTRDRTYRALIRNFKTVQDAEFEIPKSLEDTLRPYQVYGYKWLRTLQSSGFGGILADEMGLGKTLQMISIFEADKEAASEKRKGKNLPASAKPSLVVCPASLVYNWQEEIRRFAPDLRPVVVAGTSGARKKILESPEEADVFITSYDLLRRDIALYEKQDFSNCVLDEAQYIKNSRAQMSKAVKILKAEHRFALTGTPIENRLAELWSIFDYLMPGFLYSSSEFEKRFELPIAKQKDEDATAKLKAMTSPFILRRRKADVLKDLPAKLEEVRYARLSGEQQKIYDAQVVRMKEMLRGGELAGEEKIKMFAELTRIRQICCDPSLLFEEYNGESAKRQACLELIRSAMEGGHRMLIFSQFVSMLQLLEEDLRKEDIPYYKIVGSTPKEKRISLVRQFNDGNVPVFLISLKAGGTGLNLTGADVVIHYDPWWNLATQNQATDRAHRIGQTRQVTVYKLILKDTIEERIMALQDAKRDLAEAILEGRSDSLLSLSSEELMALLN